MRKGAVVLQDGAGGGGRTHTSSRIPDFESGASANSATPATNKINRLLPGTVWGLIYLPRNSRRKMRLSHDGKWRKFLP